MSRGARNLAAAVLATLALVASTGVATGHPLGNYTVNRGVELSIGADAIFVRYIVDMAEIPAFSEIQVIDRDADGVTEASELGAYGSAACAGVRQRLSLEVDGTVVPLMTRGNPELSFPAGAGGLSTLRLVCNLGGAIFPGTGTHRVAVVDTTDDGHVGWREVTIAARVGVLIVASNVVAVSTSQQLTKYPVNALQTPPDIRTGTASFRVSASAGGQAGAAVATPTRRGTAYDPLAALVGGDLTPIAIAAALLLALGLGAAHAISPGHGKTLVAAYLIGSQGSMRHAATLGITVAATHTVGVFVLGAATLLIGQFFVPERVIEWLSIGSGALVVLLGAGLVVRALRGSGSSEKQTHPHEDPHPHTHAHPHSHTHHPGLHKRNVVALGLAGGMVPSASALIVLLVAITTGRLVFGMLLIVAFGVGMALVLGGLAVVTTLVRTTVRTPSVVTSHPLTRVVVRNIPLVSGLAVTVAGLGVTIGAIARFS